MILYGLNIKNFKSEFDFVGFWSTMCSNIHHIPTPCSQIAEFRASFHFNLRYFWLFLVQIWLPLQKIAICGTPMIPKCQNFLTNFSKNFHTFSKYILDPPASSLASLQPDFRILRVFSFDFTLILAVFGIIWAPTAKNSPLWYPNGTQM